MKKILSQLKLFSNKGPLLDLKYENHSNDDINLFIIKIISIPKIQT